MIIVFCVSFIVSCCLLLQQLKYMDEEHDREQRLKEIDHDE